jgi:hypothetical protein
MGHAHSHEAGSGFKVRKHLAKSLSRNTTPFFSQLHGAACETATPVMLCDIAQLRGHFGFSSIARSPSLQYYPLYGEPLPWDQGANYPVSWVLLITFLSISAVANALCIYLAVRIRKREHRKSQTSTLFLFLNAEGLCFNLLCVTQCVGNITHMAFSLKDFGCRYQSFYATLLMLSYGFSLALLATASDRLVRHNKRLPKNFIFNYHVIVWMYCGLAAVLLSVWPGTPKLMASGTFCFPALANPLGLVMFFICGVGACTVYLIALYWRLYRFVRAKMRAADESLQTLNGLVEATDANALAEEEGDTYGILPPNPQAAQTSLRGTQARTDGASTASAVAAPAAARGAPPLAGTPAAGLRMLRSIACRVPFWRHAAQEPAQRQQAPIGAKPAAEPGLELRSRTPDTAQPHALSASGHSDNPSVRHSGPRSHAAPGSIAVTLPASPTSPQPLLRADSLGCTTNPAGPPQTIPVPDAVAFPNGAPISGGAGGADLDNMSTTAIEHGDAGGANTTPPAALGTTQGPSGNEHVNARKNGDGSGHAQGGGNGTQPAPPVALTPAELLNESKREAARSATAAAKEAKQAGRHWIFARRAGLFFAIYILCWSPFVFVTSYQLVTGWYPHPIVDIVGAQTGHLNTFFNPLLHIIFNSQFRRELRLLVAEALAAIGLHTASEWWFSSEEAAAAADGSMGGMYAAAGVAQGFSYPAAGVAVAEPDADAGAGPLGLSWPRVGSAGTPASTTAGPLH